ncbi:major facilitator superfamily domain-containing protein [Dipodascopsis tothii]|uniref:major facilitator superfamily domain-containing protein n=1 Tax=Dipodascopsis tothii TaxID=44089 RepID=UPI0034CEFCDF
MASNGKENLEITVVGIADGEAQALAEEQSRSKSKLQRFISIFWSKSDADAETRKFLRRIDLFMFSYILLSLWIKFLDSANISNAYVSGMKEDLGLYGNQLSLFSTFYYIGMAIGNIPFLFLIDRVRPSIFMPTFEILWGIIAMSSAAVRNENDLYGLRFLLGIFEGCGFPLFATVAASWYTPFELGKRMALMEATNNIAQMFSGYFQAAVYSGLNGVHGIAGWRWLFIIDGCVSVAIASLGYYALPDLPHNTRARYLNEYQRAFAIERMARVGRKPPVELTLKRYFGLFKTWEVYFFVPLAIISSGTTPTSFILWLKSLGIYTVEEVNVIPTGAYAVAVVSNFVVGCISDKTLIRLPFVAGSIACTLFETIVLAVWNVPFGLKYFAFFGSYIGAFKWTGFQVYAQDYLQYSHEMRALITSLYNAFGCIFSAFLPTLIFPSGQAPHYKYGYKVAAGINAALIIWVGVLGWQCNRMALRDGRVRNEYGLAVQRDSIEKLGESGEWKDETVVSVKTVEEKV